MVFYAHHPRQPEGFLCNGAFVRLCGHSHLRFGAPWRQLARPCASRPAWCRGCRCTDVLRLCPLARDARQQAVKGGPCCILFKPPVGADRNRRHACRHAVCKAGRHVVHRRWHATCRRHAGQYLYLGFWRRHWEGAGSMPSPACTLFSCVRPLAILWHSCRPSRPRLWRPSFRPHRAPQDRRRRS